MFAQRSSFISLINIRGVLNTFLRNASKDPGIEHRKRALFVHGENEVEDYEDLESDFMDIHKSHKDHIREVEARKEQLKHHIVKQKYFKEQLPNFLTWNDKEQIRHLGQTYPEEWTVDRLSEGFPALPETIKKILKNSWKMNPTRIANHDASVQNNWKLFKRGKIIQIPEELKKHLNKFTNRELVFPPFVPQEPTKEIVTKRRTRTEFEDIIKKYNNIKSKTQATDSKKVEVETNFLETTYDENFVTPRYKLKRGITLDELQNKSTPRIESSEIIMKSTKSDIQKKDLSEIAIRNNDIKAKDGSEIAEIVPTNVDSKPKHLSEIIGKKFESKKMVTRRKTEKDMGHLYYPVKITIPKEIVKKDCVYKLNDCYYDFDGEFLYRVPGMG